MLGGGGRKRKTWTRRPGRKRSAGTDLTLALIVALLFGLATVGAAIWRAVQALEQDPRLLATIVFAGVALLGLAAGAVGVYRFARRPARPRRPAGTPATPRPDQSEVVYWLRRIHEAAEAANASGGGEPWVATQAPLVPAPAGERPVLRLTDPVLPNRVLEDVGRIKTVEQLGAIDPLDLEGLTANLYRLHGWRVIRGGGDGPDGGVDLTLLHGDHRIVVQCKRWRRPVGPDPVRALHGVVTDRHATGAVFVTTGSFTEDAIEYASRNREMVLVDGPGLLALIKSAEPKVPQEAKGQTAPRCPKCSAGMEARNGPYGPFLGCVRFPSCRGTRPLPRGPGASSGRAEPRRRPGRGAGPTADAPE